tara:strand:+ start:411 stop:581 length:171 start_codon:yes stop_codon:yes gene_type:complete
MAKSIDKVLQSDGSYKWELVEHTSESVVEQVKKPAKKAAKPKTTTTQTTTTTTTKE